MTSDGDDTSAKCQYCGKDDSEDKGKVIWVGCEYCDSWVHLLCLPINCMIPKPDNKEELMDIKENQINSFRCLLHSDDKRPELKLVLVSTAKKGRLRKKRAIDYVALNEGNDKRLKHEHPHIKAFLACFERWKGLKAITSKQLESHFQSIKEPLRVVDPENSGMYVSTANELGLVDDKNNTKLNVDFLTQILGDDYPIDVMDVQTQMNERWTLAQWNDYYTNTSVQKRDRIKNVISLEVSHVEQFKNGIRRPKAVDNNDLVDLVWNFGGENDDIERPKVTKYILMSVQNAYTDFHLDFAGTSVYYNVISGAKKFILFPPTEFNLKQYKKWCDDDNQNLVFLGDLLKDGIAMDLTEGNLFMIPCGYIHAVYTPRDSFIVGGNFLTLRDITTQLGVVAIERATKVPKKFTFPQFDIVMGKTCEWLLESNNIEKVKTADVVSLIAYLKSPKTKYRPLKHDTKKALIVALSNKLDNTSFDAL